MPPKGRTNSKNVTKKALPPKLENTEKAETSSGLSREAEDQFELELCWCIQQLETCLINGKLGEKQAHDLGKNINVLRSNTAPLIKKRQIMRNTLGDYRTKMAQDEQKLSKAASSVKFTATSAASKKSVFLKKAVDRSKVAENCGDSSASKNSVKKGLLEINDVPNTFKFNFQSAE